MLAVDILPLKKHHFGDGAIFLVLPEAPSIWRAGLYDERSSNVFRTLSLTAWTHATAINGLLRLPAN